MPAKFISKWNKSRKTKTNKTSTSKSFKSPYASSFKTSVTNGTPCGSAVSAISRKTGKSTTVIFRSLIKAGLCKGQKINGQWIYWPTFKTKTNTTAARTSKVTMWQNFMDWCVSSGTCTTGQITSKAANSKSFTNFVKNSIGKSVKGAKRTTTKSRKARRTTSRTRTITTSRHRKVGSSTSWNTSKNWTTKSIRKTGRKYNRRTTTGTTSRTSRAGTWNKGAYTFPTWNTRTSANYRRYRQAA